MGLGEETAFLRQIPIVQNMAHDDHIGRWQIVFEEIATFSNADVF
jgi:hypothetical protein